MSWQVGGPYATKIIPRGTFPSFPPCSLQRKVASPFSERTRTVPPEETPISFMSSGCITIVVTMASYSASSLPILICRPCRVVRPVFMIKRLMATPALVISWWLACAHDLVQVEMKLAQFPTVVARADDQHPLAGGRFDGRPHPSGHSRLIDAVDDDLVAAVRAVGELGLNATALCRAEGVVRRGHEPLVTRADLAATAGDATGKWRDDARHPANCLAGTAGGRERHRLRNRLKHDVSTGDALPPAPRLLHQEPPVPDGDPPVPPPRPPPALSVG